jgi:hypothetical protein
MGRYLVLWELDPNRIPVDPKERAAAWQASMGAVGKAIEDGIIKEWGAFVGDINGFGIYEGTEAEVSAVMHQFIPFARNRVYAFTTLGEGQEWLNSMLK